MIVEIALGIVLACFLLWAIPIAVVLVGSIIAGTFYLLSRFWWIPLAICLLALMPLAS